MKPSKIYIASIIGSMVLAINIKALVDWVFGRNTLMDCLHTLIATLIGGGLGSVAVFLLGKIKWFNRIRTTYKAKDPWILVLATPIIWGCFVYYTSLNNYPNIRPEEQIILSVITALLLLPWCFYLTKLQRSEIRA